MVPRLLAAAVLALCASTSQSFGLVASPRRSCLGPWSLRRRLSGGGCGSVQSNGQVISMGLFQPQPRVALQGVEDARPLNQFLSRVGRGLAQAARFALPLVLPVILAYVLGVPAAWAKSKKSPRGGGGGTALEAAAITAAAAAAVAAPVVVKKRSLLRKILQGVNADGVSIIRGAGDTRGEFAALLNAFSSVFILSGLFAVAFVVHKQREVKMDRAMVREVEKVREYKENMYFEAVQGALEKLQDPKLKGSAKASLQKQLKDLDPDGVIRKFLEEKGERPDISYLIDRKKRDKKAKSSDKFSAVAERRPKGAPAKRPAPTSSSKSSRLTDDDDEDEGGGEEEEEEGKGGKSSTPPPAAAAAAAAPRQPAHVAVLSELSESLQDALPANTRQKLVDYLRSKIESVGDAAKRDAVVSKIAQRLGDEEYWVSYAAKL